MVTEDFMKSGNLFDYATSELSQDAFVCWLCSHWNDWDDTVRDASQNLLHAMLESDDSAPVKVLQICRQRFNVDVAVLAEHADTRTVLIVEDKTGSMEHNDQLRRYRDGVDRLFPGEPYDAARVIYYKTGSLVEYSRVKDLCDRVLGLDDILHFIGTPGTESHNAILAEYVAHLQQLQERRNMWDVVPIGDWDDNARAGYAEHLYRRITAAGWSGWGVFEKPNTQNGGHWVVSLGEERELGVRRLKRSSASNSRRITFIPTGCFASSFVSTRQKGKHITVMTADCPPSMIGVDSRADIARSPSLALSTWFRTHRKVKR